MTLPRTIILIFGHFDEKRTLRDQSKKNKVFLSTEPRKGTLTLKLCFCSLHFKRFSWEIEAEFQPTLQDKGDLFESLSSEEKSVSKRFTKIRTIWVTTRASNLHDPYHDICLFSAFHINGIRGGSSVVEGLGSQHA